MSNNKQRFLYSCIFTLIACLITMYVSYARAIKEHKASSAAFTNAQESKASSEQEPSNQAMLASYIESSQDTQKAFSPSTEIKVGLPDILEEAELTAPNGIIYPDGQASVIKIRLIATMWKKMRLNFYDEKDRLLFNSEEPVTLRAAETYGNGSASLVGDPTVCTLTSINVQKKSQVQASYRGSLTFAIRQGNDNTHTISVINTLPVEDYLKGVVPSEVPARFDNEALKAMACVARSYTLSNLGRHDKEGYDLCSGVHCHVYGGAGVENANVNAQIEATKGMIVCYNNFLADTRYHAVCGGMGESIENVWDMAQPLSYLTASSDTINGLSWNSDAPVEYISDYSNNEYEDYYAPEQTQTVENEKKSTNLAAIVENTPELESRFRAFIDNPPESYCKNASRFRWHADFSTVNFQKMLEASLPVLCGAQPADIGNFTAVTVTKRTGSGRVAELSIVTDKGSFTVNGDKIRWLTSGGKIGPSGLKSTLFYIDKAENGIIVKGGGWGHGVGLCQEGAQGRAQVGQSYIDIIKHYYPGCELKTAN